MSALKKTTLEADQIDLGARDQNLQQKKLSFRARTKKFFESLVSDTSPAQMLHSGEKPPSLQELNRIFERERFSDMLPFRSVCPDSNVFFNSDCYGVFLELAPSTGLSEEALHILAEMFSGDFPADTQIQITQYHSPNIYGALSKWGASFSGSEKEDDTRDRTKVDKRSHNIFRTISRARINYLMKSPWSSFFDDQPYVLRDTRVFLALMIPYSKYENSVGVADSSELEKLRWHKNAIIGALRSSGIESVDVDPDRFVNLLHEILNPKKVYREKQKWDPAVTLNEQVVDPYTAFYPSRMGIAINSDDMVVDARCFTVIGYPEMFPGWSLGKLVGSAVNDNLRVPCPYICSFTIHYNDKIEGDTKANTSNARATQMKDSPVGRSMASWQTKAREWSFVVKQLGEGYRLVNALYEVVLFSTPDSVEIDTSKLLSTFNANGWRLVPSQYSAPWVFMSSLPMCATPVNWSAATAMRRSKPMLSFTASNIAPTVGEWKGSRSPLMTLFGKKTGQISYLDPWDNDGNYNVACCATSGGGKSVFTQELAMSVLGQNGVCWIFDRGRSYERLCTMLDGEFVQFDAKTDISLNPFSCVLPDNWRSERIMLKALFAQMASPNQPLSQLELSWLEQALNYVWSKKAQKAEVQDVYEYLFNADDDVRKKDLAQALYPYSRKGFYGHFFKGPSTIDLYKRFVVLELQDLDSMPELQSVVVLLLMMRIVQTMYLGERSIRKLCIIDEAWKLMRGHAGEFIEEGYRTARKFEGAFMTITQGVNDYFRSPTAQAAFDNSDLILLLRQKRESIDELARTGRLPGGPGVAEELKYLRTVNGQFSDVAVVTQHGVALNRFIVDPFSLGIYTTKGTEKDEIDRLIQQGHTTQEALEIFASNQI
jgi:conjugal transfer ATP-binding protein TraC